MSTTKPGLSVFINNLVKESDGILRLKPAWVARDFLPPGRRFGLPDSEYELGERGGICERWLASTTKADNKVSVPNEGLSLLADNDDVNITLKKAVEVAGAVIMGADYASTHNGLGRLAKIFDYADRLPYHLHQMEEHARLVGCNSKEEAYYFPEDVPTGKSPETFFGVHPYITRDNRQNQLLPHLIDWKDDGILQHARGYKQIPGDGFHVPAGTLHAPGSAMTIELQEDSDVFAMLQARVGDVPISKELLYKDVNPEERKKRGEQAILDMVDWNVNGDPYFYENRHTPPLLIEKSRQAGGEEHWIFYNTKKFSGKRLIVKPGKTYVSNDNGVYSLLVWRGQGYFSNLEIAGGDFSLDELIVCNNRATLPITIENTGNSDLIIYKFFGPDINQDVPIIPEYK
ncbi:MAG: hypothetical protein H8E14_06555 [Candidatus Marinimicrobia bacterium]|nr:hypothetical protein [Candidatus Neomarinimicrobiota bacterium]